MRTYSALRSQVHTVAVPVPPAPTSTPITTFDSFRCSAAAGSRSAKTCSPLNSSASPIRTRARVRSKATPARPATATSRPQFGSPPCTAVFTSGELAIARAVCLASVVVRAPVTVTVTSLVAPSPPVTTASANSRHTVWSASTNAE